MAGSAEGFRSEAERSACRVLWFGVTYGDFRAALAASTWQGWSDRLSKLGAHYESLGDTVAWKYAESAGDLWRRAASYYHFAQCQLPQGEAKRALQECCRASYHKGLASLSPQARRLEVRYRNEIYPGHLRVARHHAPCVVLINGLDSAKEVELACFAEGFLRRGLSTFCFDGPGQGEGVGSIPIDEVASAVSTAIETLSLDCEAGASRFGVFGVSFGGHLACRIAALEPRITACISLGGFFDGSVLKRLPPPAFANLLCAYGIAEGASTDALFERISLATLTGRMNRSLLIVHGANDHLVQVSQVEALKRWAPKSEIRLYEPGEHVCTDRFSECLPMLWDWMADRLGPPSAVSAVDEDLMEVYL